jgi:GAF domain-containing protein
MERLLQAVQDLSMARSLGTVQRIVRTAARELTGCDGATFVLRDNGKCYHADEDAIAPLWKGNRFPVEICSSGWRSVGAIGNYWAHQRQPWEQEVTLLQALADATSTDSNCSTTAKVTWWATL